MKKQFYFLVIDSRAGKFLLNVLTYVLPLFGGVDRGEDGGLADESRFADRALPCGDDRREIIEEKIEVVVSSHVDEEHVVNERDSLKHRESHALYVTSTTLCKLFFIEDGLK